MASIEKRGDGYRVRYRDPLGQQPQPDVPPQGRRRALRPGGRGRQGPRPVDRPPRRRRRARVSGPRRSCRSRASLSPTTQQTYRRDLDRYVLPRFGAVPPRPASRPRRSRTGSTTSSAGPGAVVGPPPLPHAASRAPGGRREAEDPRQPVRPGASRRGCRSARWSSSTGSRRWRSPRRTSERYRTLIYVAVDTGMRWSELVGLRRASVDLARPEGPGDRAARPARRRLLGPQAAEDRRRRRGRSRSRRAMAAMLADHLGALRRRPNPTRSCSRTAPATRSRTRASRPITSARPSSPPACPAASTTCGTPASPWPSPRAPTRRRSRPAWATRSITVTLDRYGHLFPELDEAIADAFGRQLLEAQRRWANNVIQLPR